MGEGASFYSKSAIGGGYGVGGLTSFQAQETTQRLNDIVSIMEENVKRRLGHSPSMSLRARGGGVGDCLGRYGLTHVGRLESGVP